MSEEFTVEMRGADKVFFTRHFFQKHEETRKRHLYRKKNVHAVDDVSFGVKPGEIFGLLGRNIWRCYGDKPTSDSLDAASSLLSQRIACRFFENFAAAVKPSPIVSTFTQGILRTASASFS